LAGYAAKGGANEASICILVILDVLDKELNFEVVVLRRPDQAKVGYSIGRFFSVGLKRGLSIEDVVVVVIALRGLGANGQIRIRNEPELVFYA